MVLIGLAVLEVFENNVYAQATSALANLNPIWKDRNIRIDTKVRLLRSLVLYACKSWTLSAEMERRISAVEMRCYRRLLGIT